MPLPNTWLLGIAALAVIAIALAACDSSEPIDDTRELPTPTADPALADLVITMTRGNYPAAVEVNSCGGPCPDYTLTILGNGSVEYQGFRNVETIGTRLTEIPQEDVSLLLRRFEESGFFELPVDFHCQILDVGATITSVRRGDQEQAIERCHTTTERSRLAPLAAIEQLIDDLTDSAQWTGRPLARR